jgi:hypothetical protein
MLRAAPIILADEPIVTGAGYQIEANSVTAAAVGRAFEASHVETFEGNIGHDGCKSSAPHVVAGAGVEIMLT